MNSIVIATQHEVLQTIVIMHRNAAAELSKIYRLNFMLSKS